MIRLGDRERDLRLPMLAGASLITFLVMTAVGVGITFTDPSLAAPKGSALTVTDEASRGKKIYDAEGCWFCHTQSIRPVRSDLGLGPVTQSERIPAGDKRQFGTVRVGPDLFCVGDRMEDPAAIAGHLRDPRAGRSESVMPSYEFLSDEDLASLSAYVASLECAEGDR